MLTKEQRLDMIASHLKSLEEAEFYECALSRASYVQGLAGAWFADGGITPEEWKQTMDAVRLAMSTKFTLKSVTQGVN